MDTLAAQVSIWREGLHGLGLGDCSWYDHWVGLEKHWSCRIHCAGPWLGDLSITALLWASISLCVWKGDEEAYVSG